jgi:hypothetical protein
VRGILKINLELMKNNREVDGSIPCNYTISAVVSFAIFFLNFFIVKSHKLSPIKINSLFN